MTFSHEAHETSSQQQRVKVVCGYLLQQRLGSGSFAVVYKGIRIPTGSQRRRSSSSMSDDDDEHDSITTSTTTALTSSQSTLQNSTTYNEHDRQQQNENQHPDEVAIKAIARESQKITKKVLQNLEIEISILRTYRHPNIVCMHDVQKTDRHFYLVLEYCDGGDVQWLIRSRKKGRLNERLTRRLMKDLSCGLKFLWSQELIHRDIKPQNLLLTGPLPFDELVENPISQQYDNNSSKNSKYGFALKIADFGFARHLQTASLAETLCGSPLYMAPEILQHHRYDAKADLWSVGTVLFEMIAGRPPFNGENHIDLLRNIQRKAVRLPPDVRVSKECVNLLRLLLNRNPLSRAGFKEFFEACDEFVALGCGGKVTRSNEGVVGELVGDSIGINNRITTVKDLGTIHEIDYGAPKTASFKASPDSLMTVATINNQNRLQQKPQSMQYLADSTSQKRYSRTQQHQQQLQPPLTSNNIVSPNLEPLEAPATLIPNLIKLNNNFSSRTQSFQQQSHPTMTCNRLSPLTSSPPSIGSIFCSHPVQMNTRAPLQSPPPSNISKDSNNNVVSITYNSALSQSQASVNDDSGFVLVDRNDMSSPTSSQSYYFASSSQQQQPSKGMLGTSPGTGKMLLGMVGPLLQLPSPFQHNTLSNQHHQQHLEQQRVANKLANVIAATEDVGRRGVSVAHLGDSRAYLGMRLIFKTNEEGSSLLSTTLMKDMNDEDSRAATIDGEIFSSVSINIKNKNNKQHVEKSKECVEEEMPFAIIPDTPSLSLPSRSDPSVYNRTSISKMSKKSSVKAYPQMIRFRFKEALLCYLKSLKMLKGAVGAAQRVAKDLGVIEKQMLLQKNQLASDYDIPKMKYHCEVTSNWLCTQFTGVLERADAAKFEITKLDKEQQLGHEQTANHGASVEELIYNHSLSSGRDGAVKHLLGQYDAARSCYRTAGLLAETLLMEANIGPEDRTILETYVDGFSARIIELDQSMVEQSKMVLSSNSTTSSSRRESGVGDFIGPPPAAPITFIAGSPC